jgi:osmoprotectant transport system ATP-binding protein
MITISHLSKSFDNGHSFTVQDISLTIPRGETCVLLGPSGCGKTTLLRMVNQLVKPTSGTVHINGHNITDYDPIELRRSIGYVFQGNSLFPHMTVEENIAIVLRLSHQSHAVQQQRAHELLALVNLAPEKYAKKLPHQLSGGQQQRVGVARALAADPDYLLMDEPFGALDDIHRQELQQELLRLKKELSKTILFVTHDIREAFCLADKLAVIVAGKLEQVGTPTEIREQPKNPFIRELLKSLKDTST